MNLKFYAVIIGTEILNGRREDKHFKFLQNELKKRGWILSGTFIIEDNPPLIKNTFEMLKQDKNCVIFSFGGIGGTPDDYTRMVAGEVFSNGEMEFNQEFLTKIEEQYGSNHIKHRKNMAYLPKKAKLLYNNPINGMYGFYIDERIFFLAGFVEMAHPMVIEALNLFFKENQNKPIVKNVIFNSGETHFISWMKNIPKEINLSSLPKFEHNSNGKLSPIVEIQIESTNEKLLNETFNSLMNLAKSLSISIKE
jgi:molybdopterin-biosynthesis enzyme MoeA-like protein